MTAMSIISAGGLTLLLMIVALLGRMSLAEQEVPGEGPSSPVSPVEQDPDVGLDMVQIVRSKGYEIETHNVTTADGYILTIFRIPPAKRSAAVPPAVILQHGLLDSSFTWVSNSPRQSLGYLLVDSGFDVWFGNNRGNKFGRSHRSLNPDDARGGFWEFSWDEMALLDLPAIVNYVSAASEASGRAGGRVGWVGHSEGTTQMFAAASSSASSAASEELRRAVSKVALFVALAPVAYVSNQRSKFLSALAYSPLLETLYKAGKREFLPDGRVDQVAPELCRMADLACDFLLMAIAGPTKNLNASRIQVYVSATPAGTSTLNMLHWTQSVRAPVFQMMDLGSSAANFRRYGSFAPPAYNLSALAVPTALFGGDNDYLADPTDLQRLLAEIQPSGNVVFVDQQPGFAHLDFTWAVDANVKVYDKVTALLKQYLK